MIFFYFDVTFFLGFINLEKEKSTLCFVILFLFSFLNCLLSSLIPNWLIK